MRVTHLCNVVQDQSNCSCRAGVQQTPGETDIATQLLCRCASETIAVCESKRWAPLFLRNFYIALINLQNTTHMLGV